MFGPSGTTLVEAIVPLLLLAGVCAAGDLDAQTDLTKASSPTPNESVSIKPDDAPDESVLDKGTPDEGGPVHPAISPDQAAVQADVAKTRPGKRSGSRATRLRRSVSSPSETGQRSAGPTLWYQTGLGSLGIVLALVVAAAWAAKRWLPSARIGESGVLQIAARASLSPKQSVALIRLGHRYVLVSVGGDRVSALCEVAEPDEVADLAARIAGSGGPGAEVFDGLLQEESADYELEPVDGDRAERTALPQVGRGRGALLDLLSRLRKLQSN